MFLRKKTKRNDDSFDRVRQDVLMAVKVSEDEINAAAFGSPDLYDVLRTRIEAERRRSMKGRPADGLRSILPAMPLDGGPGSPRFPRWIVTAMATLLLAALATLLLLPRQANRSTQIAPASPLLIPAPPGPAQPLEAPSTESSARAQAAKLKPASVPPHKTAYPRHRRNGGAAEVATDFFPLTFTADSAASDSGHIVRVKIARTALIAFGLPMNAERTGELITADVVIGDDGLARAIRFIQ